MKITLAINPDIVDINRLSELLSKLEELGVYHNGVIEFEEEKNNVVQPILMNIF